MINPVDISAHRYDSDAPEGSVLGTIGRRVLDRAFENSVKAIEARNGAAREAA